MPQVNIDGRWHELVPGRLGLLGQRYTVALGDRKVLLVRFCDSPTGRLRKLPAATETSGGLRRVSEEDRYNYRESEHAPPRPALLVHQDVSEIKHFAQAVIETANNAPLDIWKLLGRGCRALKTLGAASPPGRVPLQCPQSLGVDGKDRVIPLDAELTVGNLQEFPETAKLYEVWYEHTNGFAERGVASNLHARALLRYVRGLLQKVGSSELERIKAQIELLLQEQQLNLDDVERFIAEECGEEFLIEMDEEEPPREKIEAAEDRKRPDARTKRSFLRRVPFSWWLVLLLGILVVVLLRPRKAANARVEPTPSPSGGNPPLPGTEDTAVLFSTYCIVFPAAGSVRAKVKESLEKLFAGKEIVEVLASEFDQVKQRDDQLLEAQRKKSLKNIPDPKRLNQLLGELARDHDIHFRGFVANSDKGLISVLEERGRFSIKGSREEHFSLLQGDGVRTLVTRGGLADAPADRALLSQLRAASVEYVSLKDALDYIGTGSAFLVPVKPTAEDHNDARQRLSSQVGLRIFVSRPMPSLFDGIDPSTGKGGSASYELQLPSECFFHQVSERDRAGIEFASTSKAKMRWRRVAKDQLIEWDPLPGERHDPKTDIVTTPTVPTFDIAVILKNKSVVVFRDQNIWIGDREEVSRLATKHITDVLKLTRVSMKDAFSIIPMPRKRSASALQYSYLAEQVTLPLAKTNRNIELHNEQAFEKVREMEDRKLSAPKEK